ncbi:MAG: type II toxin-antitoxin system VapB family antitoxin [Actinobacteria bacterium]|nr:type II toxin-antitoxin system VapB family antitoxin [Actinomycetota bacterium]MCL5444715.1 type II toxin-antitoxin system VapB family antitoxin [Actinomycetota bacterium]
MKNPEVERLAGEVAQLAGETKTEAVRWARVERHQKLTYRAGSVDRATRARRFLEAEVWPEEPRHELGRRLMRAEEEEILYFEEHVRRRLPARGVAGLLEVRTGSSSGRP